MSICYNIFYFHAEAQNLALFQKSIVHSIKQDERLIATRWAAFQNYLTKIDFIKTVKEEKFQDGFLKDIFESSLGYTLDSTNPASFNLEREKKNETDGKKADGVIVVNGEIIGIVELKDQKTKNLDQVEAQAFNYHNSHSNSKYIIISNFDELRFYIDKKTAYEKFSLFNLTYEEFKTLHLLLSYESIKENIPLKLKEKSATFEQTISKELYRDFSAFRTHLFENIVKNNYTSVIPDLIGDPSPAAVRPESVEGYVHGSTSSPRTELDKQTLLRLTQKLCDRIIFILFAEDRGLLRANTIKEIREHFKNQAFTTYALYDIYKFYFQAINEGNEKLNIPKYNGGLFATDELLDTLIIDDEYLDMEAQKLSDFDFVSEISVNILGHIFEQSLTDLEEMNATIHDTEFDKKKSKRKKDGVFYTPEYITRYIVENTLGKLCETKKNELFGSEALASPINPKKLTKSEQETLKKLYEYRDFLLNLKILDPACGSGAFLNQALEFLIREHQSLDETRRLYENELLSLYDIEANILEHNLYGVDINEDAVEIARLSLWLRTAQKGRTLTNLSDKIKCGNSLIADKSVAENAFVWEEEFPEVFAPSVIPAQAGIQLVSRLHGNDEKRGFDVVIGNPPWGAKIPDNHTKYLMGKYPYVTSKSKDTYLFFSFLSLNLLSKDGLLGFIIPNTWMIINTAKEIREQFLKYEILTIIDYGDGVFDNVTAESSTIIMKNDLAINSTVYVEKWKNNTRVLANYIDSINWTNDIFKRIILEKNDDVNNFILRVKQTSNKFSDLAEIIWGIKPYQVGHGTPPQTEEMMKNRIYHSSEKIDDSYKPLLVGSNVNRYSLLYDNDLYVKYGNNLMYPSNEKKMIHPKLIMRQTSDILRVVYDDNSFYCQNSLFIISSDKVNLKLLNLLMNSKLLNFFYTMDNPQEGKTFAEIKPSVIKDLPIKNIPDFEQEPFIAKANFMLELNKQLQNTQQNFLNELKLEKIPQKLQKFDELEFDEFVKEYTKAKKIKFADKLEERNFKNDWSALFENDKKAVLELKEQIAKTDKEIDAMVYALYGLSEDEIAIVEGK
jgi:type I restriction-modification system DNA methylase subunit